MKRSQFHALIREIILAEQGAINIKTKSGNTITVGKDAIMIYSRSMSPLLGITKDVFAKVVDAAKKQGII